MRDVCENNYKMILWVWIKRLYEWDIQKPKCFEMFTEWSLMPIMNKLGNGKLLLGDGINTDKSLELLIDEVK